MLGHRNAAYLQGCRGFGSRLPSQNLCFNSIVYLCLVSVGNDPTLHPHTGAFDDVRLLDETLTDEDFRAAARYWMSQPRIKEYLKRNVDDLTPGRLKASLKIFPDNLLVTVAPDYEYNERAIMLEEAGDALEDAGSRETPESLDLMLDAMRKVLDEYVGKRTRAVFQLSLIKFLW